MALKSGVNSQTQTQTIKNKTDGDGTKIDGKS